MGVDKLLQLLLGSGKWVVAKKRREPLEQLCIANIAIEFKF